MGAADDIRAGVLTKYQALQTAGLNTSEVIFSVTQSVEGSQPVLGITGVKTEIRYQLTPNPEVSWKRRQVALEIGVMVMSDCQLIGAFPKSLEGVEYVDGVAGDSIQTEFATPKAFREALESAEYFLVDGEKYVFNDTVGKASGFVAVDKYQSFWKLTLVRDAKQ